MGLQIPKKEKRSVEDQVDDFFEELIEHTICPSCKGEGCDNCDEGLILVCVYCPECDWFNSFGFYKCKNCDEDLII